MITKTPTTTPSVTVASLTFTDGTVVHLEPSDVVVFVGPNNVGKTQALRDISTKAATDQSTLVLSDIQFAFHGSGEDVQDYIEKSGIVTKDAQGRSRIDAFGVRADLGSIWHQWAPQRLDWLGRLFLRESNTTSRLTGSDPADSRNFEEQSPFLPHHFLYLDRNLEETISGHFHQAFGHRLMVIRQGGNKIPLRIKRSSKASEPPPFDYNNDFQYLMQSTEPLSKQGDGMRSFAAVLLDLMTTETASVLLLDEPEAFLHPPQAELLGNLIASERRPNTQLFVSTHSPDVLNGILSARASARVRVVRLERQDDVNYAFELDQELTSTLASDPAMRYLSALGGLFHDRVIVCEADADCLFYNSVLRVPSVNGGTTPDVLFIHTSTKSRMHTVSRALRESGVTVDAIADVDLLRMNVEFRRQYEALDGIWELVSEDVETVRNWVEGLGPTLDVKEALGRLSEITSMEPTEFSDVLELRNRVRDIFRESSPWARIKKEGTKPILEGEAGTSFERLTHELTAVGLWLVPVGELEGFCDSESGRGNRWVNRVLARYDLDTAVELQCARAFMSSVWSSQVRSGE